MQHKIIGKQNLSHPYLLIEVELIPDSESEKDAIKKVEATTADESQRELVTNYLLFGINESYSFHSVERQIENRFFIKATLY